MSTTDDKVDWSPSISCIPGVESGSQLDLGVSPNVFRKGDPNASERLFSELGFEAKQVNQLFPGHLQDNEYAFVVGEAGFLCVQQLVSGGLGIVRDQNGNQTPVNLSGPLTDLSNQFWMLKPREHQTKADEKNPITSDLQTGAVWKRFLPPRSIILPVVLATIAINLLALAIPLATMNIFDRVISNAAFGTLSALTIGVILAVSFDFILRNLRASVIDQSSANSDIRLGKDVFSKVLGAKSSARQIPVGVQSNALRELDGVREYFNSLTITFLGDLPFVALFLVVIAMVAGPLFWVPLAAIPVIFCVVLLVQNHLRKQSEMAFSDSAHKNAVAVDVLGGIETIKLASAEGWAADQWEKACGSQLKNSLAIRFWTATSTHMVTFLQGVTTAALLVYGVFLVTDGDLTPGALFAANLLTSRCLGPIAALATILTRFHQMKLAISSVEQLVDMEQEAPNGATRLQPGSLSEGITFDSVSFRYQHDGPAIMADTSLHISPGERVGIIGSIGSGKSTLLRLLVNLQQPEQGQVLWNGTPVHHYDAGALRERVGTVFQSATFFRGTIKDNLLLGRKNCSEHQLLRALQISGAYKWIKGQPLGLDTVLGENGAGLSGGQRQTLAIARAFVGERNCYVLDEPTSDLDIKTELAFVEHLKKLDRGKTVILVSHRQLLLEAVDRLVVMEQGRILLDGTKTMVLEELKRIVDSGSKRSA